MKVKTFDFFKLVSSDWKHREMCGVYHEDGFQIATNGRAMIVARADYKPRFERVILSKELVPISGEFVKYKKVLPDMSKYRRIDFDLITVKAEIKAMSEIVKIGRAFDRDCPCRYRIEGDIVINFVYLQRAVEFMEAYPNTELYVWEERKAVAFVSKGKGTLSEPEALLLVMPMYENDGLAWKGNFGFVKRGDSEADVFCRCRKKDIQARREAGTLTEKDNEFLKSVKAYLAMFKAGKRKVA